MGGRAYSNYAVGFNNVVVPEATKQGIPVGNTPGVSLLPLPPFIQPGDRVHNQLTLHALLPAGVLTETTAELALALTFAAARRVVEGDKFMRAGHYKGWLPTLFVGSLLQVGWMFDMTVLQQTTYHCA